MAGLWYDDFAVGQVFRHEIRKTVLEFENMLFSQMTYNPAQLHIDHAYAAETEFGRPLVNSLYTLGLVVGLTVQDTTLGTTVANLGMHETVFPLPVFAGDTIRAETEVLDLRESRSRPGQGIVRFRHTGYNQRDEAVCRTERSALMHKRPAAASPGE